MYEYMRWFIKMFCVIVILLVHIFIIQDFNIIFFKASHYKLTRFQSLIIYDGFKGEFLFQTGSQVVRDVHLCARFFQEMNTLQVLNAVEMFLLNAKSLRQQLKAIKLL